MKELTKSLENYLLAIYEIVQESKAARVKQVAQKMSIGNASTSEAIKTLAKRGYINYEPYGIITLNRKGKKLIENKIERHRIICNFLEKILMMEPAKVDEAAKNIEFSMTEDILKRFVEFLTFMETCTCKEPKWVKSFQYFVKEGKMQDKCGLCIKNKKSFDNSKCCGCNL